MRESLSMIVVLSVICAIAGFALSFLKEHTAETIEFQVLTYVQGPALKEVFPKADNNPIADRKSFSLENRTITVFPYMTKKKLMGIAIEAKGPGYGGDLGVMVGFDLARDTLLGISITDSKETPGIGDAVAQPRFSGQFAGKPLDVDLQSNGGTIDAVSGATVSSTGTVLAVRAAVKEYQALKEEIIKAWP